MDAYDRDGYEKVEELLDELFDVINESKTGSFFSGGKGLDKEEVFDIIQNIRLNIPIEIKQAQKLAENSERILNDATIQANKIIREAENNAARLINDHEITRRAKQEAEIIMSEAKQYVRDMRLGANAYAEECLAKTALAIQESLDEFTKQARITEENLSQEIRIIYSHKQELAKND